MDTLASVVTKDGPLNERDAVAWTLRLAKRVESLHRLGVAHGGLSAEAVRVAGAAPSSRAVLADVREVPPQSGYRSPERGGLDGVSPADDTWAIGATLFLLLTGTVPQSGDGRGGATTVPPLSVFGVDDDGLQRVIDKVLAPNATQRVGKVGALRGLLEEWLGDPTLAALPPLEESGSASAFGMDDDDDDEDDAATQMRDLGDLKSLMAQMAASGGAPGAFPPAASPASPPARPTPPVATPAPAPKPARNDPRRGTLLGFASPQASASPTPAAAPAPAAPSPYPGLPAPSAQVGAPSVPDARGPRPIQPTMQSVGASPRPASSPPPGYGAFPPPARMLPAAIDDDDDEDEGGGATLMMDAGPLDLSAAIESALQSGGAGNSLGGQRPSPGGVQSPGGGAPAGAVERLLDDSFGGPPRGPSSPQLQLPPGSPRFAASPSPSVGVAYASQLAPPAPPHAAAASNVAERQPSPAAPGPSQVAAPTPDGKALKIALIIGIILLIIVATAVALLYLKQRG